MNNKLQKELTEERDELRKLAYIGEHSDTRIAVIEELIADNLENLK